MNMISRFFNSIIVFLREVRTELSKTSFPTRAITVKYTLIVIAFSLVMAVFLGGLDLVFSYLLTRFV